MSISFPNNQYQAVQSAYPSQGGSVSRLQHDISNLTSDLQSGNLQGARQSFGDLQKLLQSNGVIGSATTTTSASPTSTPSSGSPASTFSSTLQNDFNQLGQDLSSGNLSAAQQDFSQLTSDAAAQQQASAPATGGTGQAGGHHHRHGHRAESDSDSSATSAPAAGTSTSASTSSPLQNDFNQIGQDLSSGNFSAVQKDFSQLTSDAASQFSNLQGSSGQVAGQQPGQSSYIFAQYSYTSVTQSISFVG